MLKEAKQPFSIVLCLCPCLDLCPVFPQLWTVILM